MPIYKTKIKPFSGTRYADVGYKAFALFRQIKRKTKRRPYVRSAYFKKEKIFVELFWTHLQDKNNLRDKTRRLKYFPCALDLIRNSKHNPTSKINPNKSKEILHRFVGTTEDGTNFFVQIKEDKNSKKKCLISVFPEDK